MSIIVNPHNQQEEAELLEFLQKKSYDYTNEDDDIVLSEEQQREILERDDLYESGKMEAYSLDEVIAHFNQPQ